MNRMTTTNIAPIGTKGIRTVTREAAKLGIVGGRRGDFACEVQEVHRVTVQDQEAQTERPTAIRKPINVDGAAPGGQARASGGQGSAGIP
jgi:hypothetical protein